MYRQKLTEKMTENPFISKVHKFACFILASNSHLLYIDIEITRRT